MQCDLAPSGTLPTWGEILGCHNWEDTDGTQWVGAKDAAKHPPMHRTALQQSMTQPRVSAKRRLRKLALMLCHGWECRNVMHMNVNGAAELLLGTWCLQRPAQSWVHRGPSGMLAVRHDYCLLGSHGHRWDLICFSDPTKTTMGIFWNWCFPKFFNVKYFPCLWKRKQTMEKEINYFFSFKNGENKAE